MNRLIRGRPLTEQERADRAEMKAFRPNSTRTPKNRKSQLLVVLALAVTFVGAWLADVGSPVGVGLFVVGLLVTVVTGVWCFRTWDY